MTPVGPGRGSAAGSVVAYLLGITGLDPLKYHLLFERFLNPERVTMWILIWISATKTAARSSITSRRNMDRIM